MGVGVDLNFGLVGSDSQKACGGIADLLEGESPLSLKKMTILEVTIDDHDVKVTGRGEGMCSPSERKFAAVIIAAIDGVAASMETGEYEREVSRIIQHTINTRMIEAGF